MFCLSSGTSSQSSLLEVGLDFGQHPVQVMLAL
jgi:hypothetical protein